MSVPAARSDHDQFAKIPTIDAFRARCEARALLVGRGKMNLIDAVDDLQADAERDGLVTRYGKMRSSLYLRTHSEVFDECDPRNRRAT